MAGALLGSFDPAFLDVPREVIQLTMRTNQKYFALTDAKGELAPNFVCVANIEASDGGEAIVAGNRKVLAARLADARYFWEHDLKVPLEEQAKKLDQIVFHEKLGTVADKAERVLKLAQWLAQERIVRGPTRTEVRRRRGSPRPTSSPKWSASFPSCRARSAAIMPAPRGNPKSRERDPRPLQAGGQGDGVLRPATVAVNIADRLDTLVAFFSIGEKPASAIPSRCVAPRWGSFRS